jgi:hypothetical protein
MPRHDCVSLVVPCLSPNRRILCTIQAINPLIAPVQISRAASQAANAYKKIVIKASGLV